jgi:tetratricopeptide (TPR) repeat protein
MLAIQKLVRMHFQVLGPLAVLAWMCGCSEPGPRALLNGERCIQERKFDKALEQFQIAVRLLPNNAQAWNHLGLAYHGLGQFQQALNAYHRALTVDHKLAAARFNLGCLLLDENDPAAAREQLTTFTLLQSASVEGWLKLGAAQLRLGQPESAERSFKVALDLSPEQPEALNGLGIAQIQKRRPLDSLDYFNKALARHPDYGPALYNLAVLTQQNLNNKSLALQRYRQYLDLKQRPRNWEPVAALVRNLEQELTPVRLRPLTHLAATGKPAPKALAPDNTGISPAEPDRAGASGSAAHVSSVKPDSRPAMAHPSSQPPSHPNPVPGKEISPPSRKEPDRTDHVVTVQPPKIEVAQVKENPAAASSRDRVASNPSSPSIASAAPAKTDSTPSPSKIRLTPPLPPASGNASHPGVVQERGNLAQRKDSSSGRPPSVSDRGGTITPSPVAQKSPLTLARANPSPLDRTVRAPALESASVGNSSSMPHYKYRHPAAPQPGDRDKAKVLFLEGIKLQQAGRQALAVERYEEATKVDPAYYEAYFNQAIAALNTADWQLALHSYEMAMAIQPDSKDAHYNFCMALKQANYPLDAAQELQRYLQKFPEDARAHLALGNLFAQQFKQLKKARYHYLKVLENDPRNPEAAKIRYWLTVNP